MLQTPLVLGPAQIEGIATFQVQRIVLNLSSLLQQNEPGKSSHRSVGSAVLTAHTQHPMPSSAS